MKSARINSTDTIEVLKPYWNDGSSLGSNNSTDTIEVLKQKRK